MIRLGMLVIVATLLQPVPAAARTTTAEGKVHQLRIYEIFEHNKAAFHQRFRQHAVRIMERHGFLILSMWESKSDGRTEFVYLLEWPSERAMKDSWARFMADQEWSDIKARTRSEHGVLVGQIQERVLHATEYSPRRSTPR